MSILLVTYDLKQPGRNYTPVHEYLGRYAHCKGMESVWLLETTATPAKVRDDLGKLVDPNDIVFVVRITGDWAARNYRCADWLNAAGRSF